MSATFEYTVNGEAQSTTNHVRTATEILVAATLDPATYYLIEMHGNTQVSYQGRAEEPIHLHEHAKFLAISTAPTPVSAYER